MSIAQDITQLQVSAKIELLVLDATVVGGSVYHFINQVNALRAPVTWQGVQYTPAPIEASGFEVSHDGPLPRPRLVVANVLSMISVLVRDYQRLENCKVIRKRTQAKYLDAVNFPGGVNATADPAAQYPDEVWYIDRVARRDKNAVEWELASPLDLAGVQLPRRQIQARICAWQYRSSECGYAGGPVATAQDVATADPLLDRCGHRIGSCKLRFGATAELPFGGFPGAGLTRNV